jgi:hypothetical protein
MYGSLATNPANISQIDLVVNAQCPLTKMWYPTGCGHYPKLGWNNCTFSTSFVTLFSAS